MTKNLLDSRRRKSNVVHTKRWSDTISLRAPSSRRLKMRCYRSLLCFGVVLLTAACAQAGQVWQSTFDSSADGVVDIYNNDSLKVMIGPASGGRLQITTADNGTNAYTPDKAGRPLGSTKGGADSFSGLYRFN